MTFEASLIYEEKSALRPPILKILKKVLRRQYKGFPNEIKQPL
jgi:hypothetical protein